MKLAYFFITSLAIVFATLILPYFSFANPYEPRGGIGLKEEEVNIFVKQDKSEISGKFIFAKWYGDKINKFGFNLFIPIYSLKGEKLSYNNELKVIHKNSVIPISETSTPPLRKKRPSKVQKQFQTFCPEELIVNWYQTETINSNMGRRHALDPFEITYTQQNYKVDDTYFSIYTPIYSISDAWSNEEYYAKIKPETFTIKFIPEGGLNLEIVSEHSEFFDKEGNNLVIHFTRFVDIPRKNTTPESWHLFVKMKPIIVKVINKSSLTSH